MISAHHHYKMDIVNIDTFNLKIAKAIKFVEEQICLTIKTGFEKKPWIHYSRAITLSEKVELDSLIKKYGSAESNQIEYYLLYHNCDEFAVFYWTVLKEKGIETYIAMQYSPFRHTYLIKKSSGERIDALLHYCGVSYPYRPDVEKFDTPRDFYAKVFASEVPQEWELKILNQLQELSLA